MRAISLWQPWATLIAIGAKQYETRSWNISYRGEIAIHAACTTNQLPIAKMKPFCDVLAAAGFTHPSMLPLGAVLCVATLVDCFRSEDIYQFLSDQEKAFGNYGPGRYAWKLTNVRLLASPIPARGSITGHLGIADSKRGNMDRQSQELIRQHTFVCLALANNALHVAYEEFHRVRDVHQVAPTAENYAALLDAGSRLKFAITIRFLPKDF